MPEVESPTRKEIVRETVKLENERAAVVEEVAALHRQKAEIQSRIDKTVADAEVTLSLKRQEYTKREEQVAEQRKGIVQAQAELKEAVEKMTQDREALRKERAAFEVEKASIVHRKTAIDQFIIALQRAYTLVS